MAHRLPFSPNTPLPLAVSIKEFGPARLHPLESELSSPDRYLKWPHRTQPLLAPADRSIEAGTPLITDEFHSLAVDAAWPGVVEGGHTEAPALSDLLSGLRRDRLWLRATLSDARERRFEIRGRETPTWTLAQGQPTDGPGGPFPLYGGIATNQVVAGGGFGWHFLPLRAWGSFEISVGDEISDSEVLGVADLIHNPRRLRLTLFPWQIQRDGHLSPRPLQTAESLGMGGMVLEWEHTQYTQAPVVHVRAERGDTLEKIADDMAVDLDSVIWANADLAAPDQPLRGELLRVPLIAALNPRKEHPSTSISLSWNEIVHGWTRLN